MNVYRKDNKITRIELSEEEKTKVIEGCQHYIDRLKKAKKYFDSDADPKAKLKHLDSFIELNKTLDGYVTMMEHANILGDELKEV